MKCRMAWFDRHEHAAAGRADFAVRRERSFNHHAIAFRLRHVREQLQRRFERRGSLELHRKFGSDRARRGIEPSHFHQMMGGGPIRVAIEQRSHDAAVDHAGKRLVVR